MEFDSQYDDPKCKIFKIALQSVLKLSKYQSFQAWEGLNWGNNAPFISMDWAMSKIHHVPQPYAKIYIHGNDMQLYNACNYRMLYRIKTCGKNTHQIYRSNDICSGNSYKQLKLGNLLNMYVKYLKNSHEGAQF